MLTKKEAAFLKDLRGRKELAVLKNPTPSPGVQSLIDRGYVRLSRVLTMFRTPTGENCLHLTEAGGVALANYEDDEAEAALDSHLSEEGERHAAETGPHEPQPGVPF